MCMHRTREGYAYRKHRLHTQNIHTHTYEEIPTLEVKSVTYAALYSTHYQTMTGFVCLLVYLRYAKVKIP